MTPPAGERRPAVRVLAPAKINLGLEVLGVREDGYHEIATVYQAIGVHDRVDLVVSDRPGIRLEVRPGGADLGPAEENLAVRAARLLQEEVLGQRGLEIGLVKRIPVGSGLGGGSSDAAAVLLGLAGLADPPVPPGRLHALASGLGADVPFFLEGGTQLGAGRGDRLTPLPPWPARPLVVVFPNIWVSTSSIYSSPSLKLTPPGPLARMIQRGFSEPFGRGAWLKFRNDLESVVVESVPAVASVLRDLRTSGSVFARVTGSGSGVFAVAPTRGRAEEWAERFRGTGYWARAVRLWRRGCRVRRPSGS